MSKKQLNKQQVFKQLKQDVFCRICKSPISGVGVFAIKKIIKGRNPFIGCFSEDYFEFTPKEIESLESGIKKYVKDMCALQKGICYLPKCGVARIDISFFLNHSKTPNMREINEGDGFVAKRDIDIGEELTVDYETYTDRSCDCCKHSGLGKILNPCMSCDEFNSNWEPKIKQRKNMKKKIKLRPVCKHCRTYTKNKKDDQYRCAVPGHCPGLEKDK
jgi:SET domain-containing protein